MSASDGFPRSLALHAANVVIDHIAPACIRIEIAGSIRRNFPYCHDVDLVVWPKTETIEATPMLWPGLYGGELQAVELKFLLEEFHLYKFNDIYPRAIKLGPLGEDQDLINHVPVELYIAEPDGSNFEALWQLRTGSAEFNILLAARAAKMGLKYRAGYGIFDHDQRRKDDGTEGGIFAALGLAYVQPEDRRSDVTRLKSAEQ